MGLEVDAYDTAPGSLAVQRALRRPLQRVLGRSGLAHWNDHVCPGPTVAEHLLREAAADTTQDAQYKPSSLMCGGPLSCQIETWQREFRSAVPL
jgi:hypothetical protein